MRQDQMYKVQGGLGGLCKAVEMYESKGDCAVLTSKNIQKAGCLEPQEVPNIHSNPSVPLWDHLLVYAPFFQDALRLAFVTLNFEGPPKRHPFDTV